MRKIIEYFKARIENVKNWWGHITCIERDSAIQWLSFLKNLDCWLKSDYNTLDHVATIYDGNKLNVYVNGLEQVDK